MLYAAWAAMALAACGSSGGGPQQARTLLRETFRGSHQINSGKLTVRLAVTGAGSKTAQGPVELDFGGPFQSQGKGQAPRSDFTLHLSALGRTATLGVLSTGTNGYVQLQGTTYQLPASTFRQLKSSFASAAGSSSGGSGALSRLGIDPLNWVRNPTVVGNDTVGGASTTHIHGGVAVARLLADLSTALRKASSLGISGSTSRLASGIPASTRARITGEVRHPTLDVWTGSSDHTLRKLEINFDLPVSGAASMLIGGMNSAHLLLLVQYADINQPQTIRSPGSARPFSQFLAKVRSFAQGLISGSPSRGSGSATSKQLQRYTQCIHSAGGDVAKMQRGASILTGPSGKRRRFPRAAK